MNLLYPIYKEMMSKNLTDERKPDRAVGSGTESRVHTANENSDQ
ncbi:hypothetical protein SAMN04488057_114111 [Cyclobacterium lianum]|uniref:Uncharacterized protein n=1 Tax=Cyclobacterium lianum TaxID=388280 RepID=A0A1M7Q6X4_9BACT|nr:hypothetical protein SAMN04488057_114111 [Cyclobacterium lianum]